MKNSIFLNSDWTPMMTFAMFSSSNLTSQRDDVDITLLNIPISIIMIKKLKIHQAVKQTKMSRKTE